jgi:phenylalanyl-tRNA synthetase alpha chain
MILNKILALAEEISSVTVKTPEELELFRLKYLSKKGIISELFEDFRNVPAFEKKEVGQKLNLLKQGTIRLNQVYQVLRIDQIILILQDLLSLIRQDPGILFRLSEMK